MRYFLIIIAVLIPHAMWAVSFDDIKGHPYAESIEYLADTGVVKGYGDGIFGPDKGVTRAEMAKIVLK